MNQLLSQSNQLLTHLSQLFLQLHNSQPSNTDLVISTNPLNPPSSEFIIISILMK